MLSVGRVAVVALASLLVAANAQVPVSTRIAPIQTELSAGAALNVPCEVDGFPEPEVYWTKDGATLVNTDNIYITGSSLSRLIVHKLAVEDSGVYGCHATNAYSSHESTIQITVKAATTPAKCTDNPFFANCGLIVRSKYCHHTYYSKFCCKSCLESGQLTVEEVEMRDDQPFRRRK